MNAPKVFPMYNCWYAKWPHFVHTFWLFTGVFKNSLVHHCPMWGWCAFKHVTGGWFLLLFIFFFFLSIMESMWLVSEDKSHCRVFVVFQTSRSITCKRHSKHVTLVTTWVSDIVSCWLKNWFLLLQQKNFVSVWSACLQIEMSKNWFLFTSKACNTGHPMWWWVSDHGFMLTKELVSVSDRIIWLSKSLCLLCLCIFSLL